MNVIFYFTFIRDNYDVEIERENFGHSDKKRLSSDKSSFYDKQAIQNIAIPMERIAENDISHNVISNGNESSAKQLSKSVRTKFPLSKLSINSKVSNHEGAILGSMPTDNCGMKDNKSDNTQSNELQSAQVEPDLPTTAGKKYLKSSKNKVLDKADISVEVNSFLANSNQSTSIMCSSEIQAQMGTVSTLTELEHYVTPHPAGPKHQGEVEHNVTPRPTVSKYQGAVERKNNTYTVNFNSNKLLESHTSENNGSLGGTHQQKTVKDMHSIQDGDNQFTEDHFKLSHHNDDRKSAKVKKYF